MSGTIQGLVQSPTPIDLLDDTGVAGAASLTSLASGSAVISAAQDNTPATGAAALWGTFELIVSFATAPAANTTVDLYLLYSFDGVKYDDGSAGASPITNNANYVGSFPLRAVSGAQVIKIKSVPLDFLKWEAQLVNNGTGQPFAGQNSGQKLSVMLSKMAD